MSLTTNPWQEGYDAYYKGKVDSDCPYEIGSDEAMSWNDGWNTAAEESDPES